MLPKIKETEIQRTIRQFRESWPERADQKRARDRRETDRAGGRAPRGRKARDEARMRKLSQDDDRTE